MITLADVKVWEKSIKDAPNRRRWWSLSLWHSNYGLATSFLKASWSCPHFLLFIFIVTVDLDRPGAGGTWLSFWDLYCSISFTLWLPYFSYRISSQDLPSDLWKTDSRNANAKEVRELWWVWWMKQKKQISYEENYEIIIAIISYRF